MGEAVGRADDEIAEGVARVETRAGAFRATDAGGLEANTLGGSRLAARHRDGAAGIFLGAVAVLARQALANLEVDLDAVTHDAREGLADQRAIPGLEPVLGETVRHRDAEAVVIDGDEG